MSLFDFGPTSRYHMGPLSNVQNMMGWLAGMQLQQSAISVWLEADVGKMGKRFYDAETLGKRAKGRKYPTPGARSPVFPRFIFGLEAGYDGPLPVEMLASAVFFLGRPLKVLARVNRVDEGLLASARQLASWHRGR